VNRLAVVDEVARLRRERDAACAQRDAAVRDATEQGLWADAYQAALADLVAALDGDEGCFTDEYGAAVELLAQQRPPGRETWTAGRSALQGEGGAGRRPSTLVEGCDT
jgi:hypothetical protein